MSQLLVKLVGLNTVKGSLFAVTSMDVLFGMDKSLSDLSPGLIASLASFRDARNRLFDSLGNEIVATCDQLRVQTDTANTDTGEAIQDQLNSLTFGKF